MAAEAAPLRRPGALTRAASLALWLALAPAAPHAQAAEPIFTDTAALTSDSFSFFVVGHAYGAHTEKPEVYGASPLPAASLLANLETLRRHDLGFFTGDVVQACGARSLAQFKQLVADRLALPLFNAKGNHDNCPEYNERHKGHFAFSIGPNRFVILASSSRREVDFLAGELGARLDEPGAQRLFVFSHRPFWTTLAPELALAARKANIRIKEEPYLTDRIAPLVQRLGAGEGGDRLYWFSGDVGTPKSYPVLFHPIGCCVQLMASGLNDNDMDNYLHVEVGPDDVRIEVRSLTGRALDPLAAYDVKWLEAFFERP